MERQPVTEEVVQMWLGQLEGWTRVFYNEAGANPELWREAQSKLVQFQKISNPFELCTEIIKKTQNPLILYQATLCLRNSVANDVKRFDLDELFKLFQFLYEFLCARALENEMSVNEMAAVICAMTLKMIASERARSLSAVSMFSTLSRSPGIDSVAVDKDSDRITQVIKTLCHNIQDLNENLSKKIASALMLNSLLVECHLSNRSTLLGIRVWKHLEARRIIEGHLKAITEACLGTINWAFTSNMLNPANQTRETQILFHLVGTLMQCVECALSFNSFDTGANLGTDRVLRVIQSRTISMLSQASEYDQRVKTLKEWCNLVMDPSVVQFLFNLYTSIKSMINTIPGWDWPSTVLKNSMNCLYFLSDVHNSINIERDARYTEFVGHMMLGAVKLLNTESKGIDDSFQIACLITSISMHTSETRDTITKIKAEHFVPFLEAAKMFTCKVFTHVASTLQTDEEEEEEKTVDALLDFWYHLLRNIEAEIKLVVSMKPPQAPKISTDQMKAFARYISESYISCHLHKPLGQLVEKQDNNVQELDLDNADEQDDNAIHGEQLISFGMISRFDAPHTAKLLIQLIGTRVSHLEALLTQCINNKTSPESSKDWEYINDDLHWLLLMLQHYMTQTGYGEIGFMCNEILGASISFEGNLQKTLQAFDKCDYSDEEVDPIVRLVLLAIKLCQIEMGVCQSGNLTWLSAQTQCTLTSFLSRFCLTYLYPKESDYSVISETMNYCFGQDAPPAEKFLKFVIEHSCCIIMFMKSDLQIVKKNIQLLIQLLMYHPNVKEIMSEAEDGSMIKLFTSNLRPENLTGFSPRVAKSIIKLATRLFVEDDDWNRLTDFFTKKWNFIMTAIQTQQHQSEMVVSKFLEFCDFVIGVCEACDEETSERLFEQLLLPIVQALPNVMKAFGNFETVPIAVFELLYFIVKLPMVNIASWENQSSKTFYESCTLIIEAYSQIAHIKKNRTEEEDCEDIIALLNFSHETMKRDWGHTTACCDTVVKYTIEKLSAIMKEEYLQFPRIRQMYYRLLVYLVDEEERLLGLSDTLLQTIVSSVILALLSQFDKDVDNHTYTIISIVCRTIYHEKETPNAERLARFMAPILPAFFHATISQGSYTINTEAAETMAPALFALRCCYMETYQNLVKELIEKQDDAFIQAKVKSLFENLEMKIQRLILNRTSCREFNTLFVPFLAELHNYITTK